MPGVPPPGMFRALAKWSNKPPRTGPPRMTPQQWNQRRLEMPPFDPQVRLELMQRWQNRRSV